MKETGSIYALIDPRFPADHIVSIRYVGMTGNSLEIRLRHHRSEARKSRRDYYQLRWLRSLASAGLRPVIIELERVSVELLPMREREWIARHRAIGCQLTNATGGGEGVINPSEETRAKMRNRIVTPETRAKLAAINTGKRHSQETRAKISTSRTGVRPPPFSADHRENMRLAKLGNQAWLGKHHSDETKRKCSAAKMGNTGRLGMPHGSETKRKLSLSHAGDKSSSAKLTWPDVFEIRKRVAAGMTQTATAKIFSISQSTVSEIVANKIWIVPVGNDQRLAIDNRNIPRKQPSPAAANVAVKSADLILLSPVAARCDSEEYHIRVSAGSGQPSTEYGMRSRSAIPANEGIG